MLLPQTLQVLRARHQDRVERIDDERDTDDGYWLYLRPGFCVDRATHVIHEDSVPVIVEQFKEVQVCDCSQCSAAVAPQRTGRYRGTRI